MPPKPFLRITLVRAGISIFDFRVPYSINQYTRKPNLHLLICELHFSPGAVLAPARQGGRLARNTQNMNILSFQYLKP